MEILVFFFADLSAPAAICLAVGGTATVSIPALLLADAHRADFDPRPAVSRLVESGRLDALLVAVGPAPARLSVWLPVREACRDAAALFLLLTTSPKGAMAA